MPWETQFNIEQTLEKALNVFWRYGYNATSMRDLSKCMGINAGSIYSTYGSKRELFLSALEYYNNTAAQRLDVFMHMDSAAAGIIGVFEHVRDQVLDGTDRHGCFVVNTTLEMAPHDKQMQALVTAAQQQLRDFFKALIRKGQKNTEIDTSLNAADTSELLLNLLVGLRVLTRNNPDKRQFDIVTRNVKSILGG